jgi:benzil reductase ((S)-benzoin forming)
MTQDLRCITLITGASRGMGEAIALACAARGDCVLGLSRGHSDRLAAAGAEQWPVDLADAAPVAQRLARWLQAQAGQPHAGVTLINNAGVIAPLRDLARIDAADTAQALRVGLEAPALLSAAFLAATAGWTVPRKLLNISSGLGRRAMAGSASYCAAKAGLDHLSRCLALEEAARPNGARVVSLAPGVIATDMQVQLRGADPAEFADRGNFVAMHDNGQLLSPEAAAARILAFLDRADFGEQPVADVRG